MLSSWLSGVLLTVRRKAAEVCVSTAFARVAEPRNGRLTGSAAMTRVAQFGPRHELDT